MGDESGLIGIGLAFLTVALALMATVGGGIDAYEVRAGALALGDAVGAAVSDALWW